MSPLELIQDADALAEMSPGEQLYAGAQVAVLGMVIVFIILLILLITIKVIERFFGNRAAADKMAGPTNEEKIQEGASSVISGAEKSREEKEKLSPQVLAAITASIQEFYRGRSDKFRIIRVKKNSSPVSPWMRDIDSEAEAVETRSENREVM